MFRNTIDAKLSFIGYNRLWSCETPFWMAPPATNDIHSPTKHDTLCSVESTEEILFFFQSDSLQRCPTLDLLRNNGLGRRLQRICGGCRKSTERERGGNQGRWTSRTLSHTAETHPVSRRQLGYRGPATPAQTCTHTQTHSLTCTGEHVFATWMIMGPLGTCFQPGGPRTRIHAFRGCARLRTVRRAVSEEVCVGAESETTRERLGTCGGSAPAPAGSGKTSWHERGWKYQGPRLAGLRPTKINRLRH